MVKFSTGCDTFPLTRLSFSGVCTASRSLKVDRPKRCTEPTRILLRASSELLRDLTKEGLLEEVKNQEGHKLFDGGGCYDDRPMDDAVV